uniref:Geranylgeranyl transferase type-2 subunit alpha n=1 Tax=Bursaphelenchus xylophilus TaxID=6326 RepID=A0A1I7S097_BURXY
MHGVKKSPASEAQLAALKKERAEKLQKFVYGKTLVFKKRENCEYDEELLEITGEIVKKQPNLYTVWNIRREMIELITKRKEVETVEEYRERLKGIYENELKVSLEALLSDPKSYSAWYHRDYVLTVHPKPDFKAELELCEKALSVDCRNFHCWDHRRYTAKLAKLDEKEELEFSDRLVTKNPSNYSAWHYRGTLLPKIAPNPNGNPVCIDNNRLEEEFNRIKGPTCYNTEDQTGWTYCRWLSEVSCVGPVESPILISIAFPTPSEALLVFNKAVEKELVQKTINGNLYTPISVINLPKTQNYQRTRIWKVESEDDFAFPLQVIVETERNLVQKVTKEGYSNKNFLVDFYSMKKLDLNPTSVAILNELINICKELMKDDDKNPWEPLTLARTLLLLSGPTQENVVEVESMLKRTAELDPQRRNVYKHLIDNVRLGAKICNPSETLDKLAGREEDHLDLNDLEINSVELLQLLSANIRSLNLQRNRIENTKQFNSFQLLTDLTLDDNPVKSINSTLHLPHLEFLSLARCPIESADSLKSLPTVTPNLKRLLICETPLAKNEEQLNTLRQHFEQHNFHIKIFVHYL